MVASTPSVPTTCRRQILNGRQHAVGADHTAEVPGRNDELQERHHRGACDADREHPVPHRGGPIPEQCSGGERDRRHDRDFDRRAQHGGKQCGHFGPSLRAFVISAAIRSSSSCDSFEASPPRSAATVFSAEPSKNVSTTWRSADLRAAWRGSFGTYTYRSPCSSWCTWPFSSRSEEHTSELQSHSFIS